MQRYMVAALIVEGRRLLLVHNTKHGLRIEPPGGKKESGETWEDAEVREVKEELGVAVLPAAVLGDYATTSPEGDFLVRMFFCDVVGGAPRVIEPTKVSGFAWYSYGDLERLRADGRLVPNMCAALPELKRRLQGMSLE